MRRAALLPLLMALLATTAGAQGRTVSGYGISARPPSGWHARVLRGALEASTLDLSVVLYEDAAAAGAPFDTGFYRRGHPRPFSARDFGRPPLGGSNPGDHRFARTNFTVAGRYFDLFAESSSPQIAPRRLAGLNALVRSLRISRGDFYPGNAPPALYPRMHGWFRRHSPTVPVGPSTSSVTIASTVPYRDCLYCFPPHRTVSRLGRDGVVVYLTLEADNRNPPTARAPSALRIRASSCGSFEGSPADVATCPLHAEVPGQYDIDGWVVFGRAHPTAGQLAAARAELGRLILPRWPRWPRS